MRSGRMLRKKPALPAGANAMKPVIFANADALIRLSTTSRRKLVLRLAACSGVSGGTRRVLVRPAIEAFAITAMAQLVDISPGAPLGIGYPHIPLNQLKPRSSQYPPR